MTKIVKEKSSKTTRKKPLKVVKEKNLVLVDKVKQIEELAKETTEKSEVGGFLNFLKEQNVAGLAIGLAVGTAATDTVRKFVQGFVDPIVQLMVGSQESLQQATWSIDLFGRNAEFQWGLFLSSFISLIATAAIIYAALRMTGLYKPSAKNDKKSGKKGK